MVRAVTNLDGGRVELLDVDEARHGLVLPGEDLVQVGGGGLHKAVRGEW